MILPINIYHGKDTYPIKKKILNLEIKLKNTNSKNELSYQTSYINQATIMELEELLFSPSFGVNNQIIVIWNYDKNIKIKNLIPLFKQFGNNYLFLISTQIEWKKKINDKFLKSHKSILNYEWIRYPEYSKIKSRLEQFSQNNHIKIDASCLDYLIKYFQKKSKHITEAKTDLMEHELNKITLFFRKGSILSIDKVTEIIDDLKEEKNEFEIINAFFDKNISLTLKNLLIFLNGNGDFNSLIARFIFETTNIVKFKELLMEQKSISQVFLNLGFNFKIQKDNMIRKNALFNFNEILVILEDLILIDKRLKTSSLTNSNTTKNKIPLKVKLAFEKLVLLRLK